MKKSIVYICALAYALTMFGCAKKDTTPSGTIFVASFYPVYIMALNATKNINGIHVVNLTPPVTGCLHDYQVTSRDMEQLEHARFFIANGAGMESFMDKVVSQYPLVKVVQLAHDIPLITDAHGVANPHVWVSVSNAITEMTNLRDFLVSQDSIRAKEYTRNCNEYLARLEALRSRMVKELAPFKGSRIITFHEAFPYFAHEFGFEIAAVVEREPGSEPSAKELAETITLIRHTAVKALFSEPQYPPSVAEVVARETGTKVFVLDPAVTGTDSCDAYIDIMEKNLLVLKEALK